MQVMIDYMIFFRLCFFVFEKNCRNAKYCNYSPVNLPFSNDTPFSSPCYIITCIFSNENTAHALITICETHLLFGGCSTFLHGGELKYPNSFVAIDENGAAFFQTLNGMMLSGLGVDLNIIPNTLTEYPNLNPASPNDLKYMGSAISGTGASGFDIQRDRKGHVDLRYNAFPYPKDFVNVTENQQGYYSALAFGTGQEFADAYKTGSITRQCRDFERYSYKLTYDDVDEFLTMASVYDRLVPAEARVNNARDGSFRTIPPSGSPERRDLIDSYLSKRYV